MARFQDNRQRARVLSIALTVIVLATIVSATLFHFPPDKPLTGAENAFTPTPLTARNWFDGSFAKNAEAWMLRRFGLRGYAIRLANQLDYSLFGKLPESRGTGVIRGKDGWLYENTYRRFYEGQYSVRDEQADLLARQLSIIQKLLAERGTRLVVVIAPSKLEVYPEYLPDVIVRKSTSTPAREQIARALEKHNVPLVDAHSIFLDWKQDKTVPLLFPKCGTHWNAYGAQRIFDEILKAAGMEDSIPHVIGYEFNPPLGTDSDLLRLLNIPFYKYSAQVPYPLLSKTPAPSGKRLRSLLVGDSFSYQLIDAMGRTGSFSNARFVYYLRSIFDFSWEGNERLRTTSPEGRRTAAITDHQAIDWNEFLAGYDILILEFNEIFSRDFLWGFAQFALDGLSSQPPPDARKQLGSPEKGMP